jgi:hypothetical protein
VLAVFVTVAVVVVAVVRLRSSDAAPGGSLGTVVARVSLSGPTSRDTRAYAGQGAWVDAFDYGPTYQKAGAPPPITPASVDDMAAHGVKTLFIQATRADSSQPGGFVDRALVAEFLIRAHRDGIRVVGWYLPTFADENADLARMTSVARFNVLGHRFDGLAVDIEDVDTVPDVDVRNERLIDMSQQLRAEVGSEALGAIVLPPVLTEVVNPRRWPDFPWSQLAPLYNVWLPMSYWTFRTNSSGYHDGYTYNEESTRRLRANLGDPNALVHGIGGIADTATPEELTQFAQSLFDTQSIGGSIYDWNTLSPESRALMTEQFATGPGASLPQPP